MNYCIMYGIFFQRSEDIKQVVRIDDEGSGDDENVGLNEVCYCDIKKCFKFIINLL